MFIYKAKIRPSNPFLNPPPSYIAMNQIPTVDQLSHVNQLSEAIQQQPGTWTNITAVATQAWYIGGGLPSIPEKLVRHIQDGRYINIAELLPDNLEASNATDDDQPTTTKRKLPDVTQIMDWIQCFSIYIAVVSCAKSDHVADLIAYLNLIINSQRRFQDFDWTLYDCLFWQKAATTPSLQWGTMEGTLWNLSRLNHSITPSPSARLFLSTPSTRKVPICFEWNEDPHEGCPHLNCHYEYVCYCCINIPTITDNRHKDIHCPNKQKKLIKPTRQ